MDLKIYWTDFAKDELKNIFSYYKVNANKKTANNITKDITQAENILQKQAKIGQVEQLLLNNKQEFRYLISRKNYILDQL